MSYIFSHDRVAQKTEAYHFDTLTKTQSHSSGLRNHIYRSRADRAALGTWTKPKHDDVLQLTTPETEDERNNSCLSFTCFSHRTQRLQNKVLRVAEQCKKCVCVFCVLKILCVCVKQSVLMRISSQSWERAVPGYHTQPLSHTSTGRTGGSGSGRLQQKSGWDLDAERN